MSVEATTTIQHLGDNGFLAPALPDGRWQAQVAVAGDGSSGTSTLSVVFAEAAAAPNEQLYSLEYLSFRNNAISVVRSLLNIINMLHSGSWSYPLLMEQKDTGVTGNASRADMLQLPLFLGSQDNLASEARLEVVSVNTNVVTDRITVGGYFWTPRAILADGGPQRPPTSLWG